MQRRVACGVGAGGEKTRGPEGERRPGQTTQPIRTPPGARVSRSCGQRSQSPACRKAALTGRECQLSIE